jgi:hypothetical protein
MVMPASESRSVPGSTVFRDRHACVPDDIASLAEIPTMGAAVVAVSDATTCPVRQSLQIRPVSVVPSSREATGRSILPGLSNVTDRLWVRDLWSPRVKRTAASAAVSMSFRSLSSTTRTSYTMWSPSFRSRIRVIPRRQRDSIMSRKADTYSSGCEVVRSLMRRFPGRAERKVSPSEAVMELAFLSER